MSQNEAAKTVQEHKYALKKRAEDLVLKGFTEKIIELNELSKTPLFKKNIEESYKDCNVVNPAMICLVKPHIWELVENANQVKMWILYMIKKIEGSDNFKELILKETLAEVMGVERECTKFFDNISRYFVKRRNLESKIAKNPQNENYRRSVAKLGEELYLVLWHALRQIRNRYCYLQDLVIQSLEKFKTRDPNFLKITIRFPKVL